MGYDVVSSLPITVRLSRHNDERDEKHNRLVEDLNTEIWCILESGKYLEIEPEWGGLHP